MYSLPWRIVSRAEPEAVLPSCLKVMTIDHSLQQTCMHHLGLEPIK
jgi:hypothetical protein